MSAAAPTAHAANGVNGSRLSPPFDDQAEQGIWACGDTPLPAQLWQAGGGAPGGGFGQDGILDGMPPGPELGLLLPGADDMAGLSDGELTGVVRGWRRMGSWAAAMEHAAAAELARRRIAEAESAGAPAQEVARYVSAEVAAALTLTSYSADGLMGRALSLAGLPETWAALAAGQIDVPKAFVILNGVSCLSAELAQAVEAAVVPAAGKQTTGELRKAVAQAVIAADPAAADRRVAEAVKSARVERWAEPSGTAAIAGRDLPVAEVLAADNRVNALAAALKADGAPGGMDLLRAQVFLGLLLGRPVAAPANDAAVGTADFADDTPAATGTGTGTGTAANVTAGTATTGAAEAAHSHARTGSGVAGPRLPRRASHQGGAAVAGGAAAAGDSAAADGTLSAVRGDAAVSGRPVPVGPAAGAGSAQPPGAAGTEGEPAGPVREAEQVPTGMPQVRAGETAGIPAGLRRVRAGLAQLAEHQVTRWPGMAGRVNLTIPLRALLGQPSQPAEAAGFGPLSPSVTRELLTAAQDSPAIKWCVTVTDDDGRAAGHGCATRATGPPGQPGQAGEPGQPGRWAFALTVRALESGECGPGAGGL